MSIKQQSHRRVYRKCYSLGRSRYLAKCVLIHLLSPIMLNKMSGWHDLLERFKGKNLPPAIRIKNRVWSKPYFADNIPLVFFCNNSPLIFAATKITKRSLITNLLVLLSFSVRFQRMHIQYALKLNYFVKTLNQQLRILFSSQYRSCQLSSNAADVLFNVPTFFDKICSVRHAIVLKF